MHAVIATASLRSGKQSSLPSALLDRFVASLLAMTPLNKSRYPLDLVLIKLANTIYVVPGRRLSHKANPLRRAASAPARGSITASSSMACRPPRAGS